MKIENKSTKTFVAFDIAIKAGEILEVDEEKNGKALAILLKQKGISEYGDLKKQKELENENEKLKNELALVNAKQEADKLGIKYAKNIGLVKLLAKIDEFKIANTGNAEVDNFLNGETEQLPQGTEEITEAEAEKLEADKAE